MAAKAVKTIKTIEIPCILENNDLDLFPLKKAPSLFHICASKKFSINVDSMCNIATGIRLNMPELIIAKNESVESSFILQAHVSSIHKLCVERGIIIISPSIIPVSYTGELVLLVANIGKKRESFVSGDPIAELWFSLSPNIDLTIKR